MLPMRPQDASGAPTGDIKFDWADANAAILLTFRNNMRADSVDAARNSADSTLREVPK